MSGWEELGPEFWITQPQCPMKGQSRTTLRLKQSGSLPLTASPLFPPPLAATLHTSAHNKQNRPKRRGMKRTVCFCLLLGPPTPQGCTERLADFVKATANVTSVLLDVAAKRAWVFWDDNVRAKITWCGDGIKGYTWKRRVARVQLCVPCVSVICIAFIPTPENIELAALRNASKSLSY